MPFDATGTYTPPTGAENAFPGKIIASATWNAIFIDIAAALTLLGQQSPVQAPRVITSTGNITVAATDFVIEIQASVPQIQLPASSLKSYPVRIIGAATGIFSSHNSQILPSGGQTLSGAASLTLTTDYQTVELYPLSTGGYLVLP